MCLDHSSQAPYDITITWCDRSYGDSAAQGRPAVAGAKVAGQQNRQSRRHLPEFVGASSADSQARARVNQPGTDGARNIDDLEAGSVLVDIYPLAKLDDLAGTDQDLSGLEGFT